MCTTSMALLFPRVLVHHQTNALPHSCQLDAAVLLLSHFNYFSDCYYILIRLFLPFVSPPALHLRRRMHPSFTRISTHLFYHHIFFTPLPVYRYPGYLRIYSVMYHRTILYLPKAVPFTLFHVFAQPSSYLFSSSASSSYSFWSSHATHFIHVH